MKTLIKDIDATARHFKKSYLSVIMPASVLLLTALYTVSIFGSENFALFMAVLMMFAFTTVTPLARTGWRGVSLARSAMTFVDSLIVCALLVLVPKPELTGLLAGIAISAEGTFLFFAIVLLITRGMRAPGAKNTATLFSDIAIVWTIAPSILWRMCVGIIPALALAAIANMLSISNDVLSIAVATLIIVPATFLPFLLIAEGLQRSVIAEQEVIEGRIE